MVISSIASFITYFLTMGMSHCGLAIYIKKYLKAKEELWKLKSFTMQKYKSSKNPLKETKIPQDIIKVHSHLVLGTLVLSPLTPC